MPTSTPYLYTIPTDFPGLTESKPDPGALDRDVRLSSIVTALDGVQIDVTNTQCTVTFKDVLSVPDKTVLDGVVASHTGVPEKGSPEVVKLDLVPQEADGKIVAVISPATEGWMTWFTGAGDNLSPTPPASGRGTGTPMRVDLLATETGAQAKEQTWEFSEPVELHDGAVYWDPSIFGPLDTVDFFIRMPATVTVPNGGGTGNCNRVPSGQGFDIVVPAAGNGAYDVDLANAVPVPVNGSGGYWDTNYDTGDVTPAAAAGTGEWNLLTVPIENYFIRRFPLANPLGIFEIETYKAEWISPRWKSVLRVNKDSNTPDVNASVSGWNLLFRKYAT